MSTYMEKAGQVERKWYVIDAAGKTLGRVAAQAAVLLRGKHKPTFTPHVDCGELDLTSVVQNFSALGEAGVKYLIDLISGKPLDGTVYIPVEFHNGKTVKYHSRGLRE